STGKHPQSGPSDEATDYRVSQRRFLLEGLDQGFLAVRSHGEEEPARGLWIREEPFAGVAERAVPGDLGRVVLEVPARAAGHDSLRDRLPSPRQHGHAVEPDLGTDPGAARHPE